MTVTTSTRDYIIDALVERGCAVLEVTWVHDMPSLMSWQSSQGGVWAATYRRQDSDRIEYVTGRFLGQIISNLDSYLAKPAQEG